MLRKYGNGCGNEYDNGGRIIEQIQLIKFEKETHILLSSEKMKIDFLFLRFSVTYPQYLKFKMICKY